MSKIIMYDLAGTEGERRFSPYCWRIRLALAHKQLDFEARPTRFTEIAGICGGGQKTLPVIEDGSRVMGESRDIAEYLEDTYPDKPSLFGGDAGRALTRFVDNWVTAVVQPALFPMVVADIHAHVDEASQDYFRSDREKRLGRPMEEAQAGREKQIEMFRRTLHPLRMTVRGQSFLGGDGPLYADYIACGAFLWASAISDFRVLEEDDPIFAWFERCRDLHGGLARSNPSYY